ncbi:ExeM/NucH family extracellular endonuclease [Microbacterium hibisci]|uniref:ExeM/NucH family extracellular endonuclease n=1 Tax=Microbacterium hibisci TaxID=2036000 RepID=UPI0019453F2D|nr:ExeM/NucH family extracellular endonuclease [Microbacterium hibisci]
MSQSPRRAAAAIAALSLAATGVVAFAAPAAAAPGDLLISEYVEGSSNNKAIEIYNPGTTAVDLAASGYKLQQFTNGSGAASITINLTGSVAPGDVFVFAHSLADAAILAQADQSANLGLFNGNDAVALVKGTTAVDVIGQIGFDPGTQWGADLTSTADNTLRRNLSVVVGDEDGSNPFDPAAEWTGYATNTFDGLGWHGAAPEPEPDPVADCSAEPVKVGVVQGSGTASPILGQDVLVEGVVVADFQTSDLDGFYLQGDADGDPATSDGIFVYQQDADNAPGNGDGIVDVAVGDVVSVAGSVAEFQGNTQVVADDTAVCGTAPVPAPVALTLPLTDAKREQVEGMHVTLTQSLVVGEYFEFGRFNTVTVAPERQYQSTHTYEPGTPEQAALAAANLAAQIIVDDARSRQNPDPLRHPNGEPYTLQNLLRGGDVLTGVTGILDQRVRTGDTNPQVFSYGIQPTAPIGYQVANPRPEAPEVGGDLKVASFNVLNYFTTLGSRGAENPTELARQQAKIVSALAEIDADVFGLIEIENNGDAVPPAVPAVETLTNALNAVVGAGTYSYIATGKIGTDVITTAFVYKTATVTPLGAHQLLTSKVDPRFIDTLNRPALAQTFAAVEGGEPVTVVVNHLKSKSSACDEVGDPDTGDGQGNCAVTRTNAAAAMVDWLATDPTGSGSPDRSIVIGDLNAYAKEDPIRVFTDAGYTDLLDEHQGDDAYSYVFDGQLGYLDHALAAPGLAADVTDASTWAINADEPSVLDYNTNFKPASQVTGLYAPDAYRSSDHDPVIVGIDLDTTPPVVTLTATPDRIFPPNGKLREVTVEVGVEDESDVTVELVSAEAIGAKAEVTTVDDTTFEIVAANKSVYRFTYTVTDAAGNATTETVEVVVGR